VAGSINQIFDAIKGGAGAYLQGSETSNPKEARKELDNLWESIKRLPVVGKVAATAFDGLSKATSVATGAITSGLGALTAGAQALTQSLSAPLAAIQSFGNEIGGLVRLANPGAFHQFQIAMQDAWAVLGGQLTPVLQGLTILGRAVGDNLAKLTPVVQPLFDKIGQGIANIAEGVGPIIEGLAPLVEVFIDVMVELTDWFTKGVALWQGIVAEVLETINSLFGLTSKRFNKDADDRGAAVRGVGVSSVEQFGQDVFKRSVQNAFGTGQGKKPEEHIPEIAAAVNEGKQLVRDLKDYVGKFAEPLAAALAVYNAGKAKVEKAEGWVERNSPAYAIGKHLAGQALKK
jgi:hypothetical protein